jgi:pimeloyl-ACP methyl ester carboxylesterase
MEHGCVTEPIKPGPVTRRPSILNTVLELRFPLEAAALWLRAISHPWPQVEEHNAKVALLIPGFMAGDATLLPLANFCRWLGHRVVFPGIWSNSRCPRETVAGLAENLGRVRAERGQRLVIIGQSLGGVYARALAARLPDCVERVVTLGSPIRDLRDSANPAVVAAANLVVAVRRLRTGCLTESCPCGMALVELDPGEVPTTVVYSRTDGVVHWQSCIDRSGSPMVENVEVMASHVGMGLNVDVYRVVADRLAMPRRAERAPAAIPASVSNGRLFDV